MAVSIAGCVVSAAGRADARRPRHAQPLYHSRAGIGMTSPSPNASGGSALIGTAAYTPKEVE
ncbi:hypothetical protein GCM10022228_03120 [Halomonas cibimaris]|uniref:Uncharacterized protein n=1 Tax=Halomonas cibimaris TaxID=657012 RepID=A0ABP7L7W6_9GAMM